ncbi:MAG: ATP-binding protein [Chitinophagaceae bacterium]|nr:ATP-binding protein [Chitinophagaceae bacterium]
MKKIIVFLLVLFTAGNIYAQDKINDSLRLLLSKETTDIGKVKLLVEMGSRFGFGGLVSRDSSLAYLKEAIDLSEKINYTKGIISARQALTYALDFTGNYPQALEIGLENLQMAEKVKDSNDIFWQTRAIIWIYEGIGDYKTALTYAKKLASLANSESFREASLKEQLKAIADQNLGIIHFNLNSYDSALYYQSRVYKNTLNNKSYGMFALGAFYWGNTYAKIGNNDSAFLLYRTALPYSIKVGRLDYAGRINLSMASLFYKTGQTDSALFYARQALTFIKNTYAADVKLGADSLLSQLFHGRHQYDSAYKYLNDFVVLNDSLKNRTKITQAQNLSFTQTLHEQQLTQAKKDAQQQFETRLKFYVLAAVILIILIIVFLLLRNNRNKRKANILLSKQKDEIQSTLSELKSTQAQLIQSEKMASLGELTAGIAHEIQNPLNFVNNFSEINKEMLDELRAERSKPEAERDNSLQDELINDVYENSEKINHHGKRADAIVKGMLQHSRTSTGQKEPTDINALCDEYLRLAYHGMRAKDKSFNCTMETHFDSSLPKINVVPQDIGRVILNLINNAFYACAERSRSTAAERRNLEGFQKLQGLAPYLPTVTVSTKNLGGKVEISVRDNGNGIPEKIKDKIFQPFFTTKPTGQGTGLGLSLSYDIVKAHGGEMKVESMESKGTEFIVQIPAK